MRAIVVGAGIGGVTCSIALRRAGADVTVLERRPDVAALSEGGGMVIWHNAILALREVGVELEELGVPLEQMSWRSSSGASLGSWPLDVMRERFGVSAFGVTRAALHARLAAAMPKGALRTGYELAGYTQSEDGVVISTGHRGDALIGADGLHSTVRRLLKGPEQPRYAGYGLDFGIAALEHPALVMGFREWDGPGARLISFPVAPGQWYWCSIHRRAARGADAATVSKAELLSIYRGWPAPVEAMVEATDEASMFGRDGLDRKPTKEWGKGRVTLLGDAAHPMTPNLGQGACQAIEDAIELGRCIATVADPAAALREYERRRISRTAYFVKRSQMIGAVGRWRNPLACRLRDQLQERVVPGVAFREHFKKLVLPR